MHISTFLGIAAVSAIAALTGAPAFADEGSVSVGSGLNTSSGKYGTTNSTNITSIPFVVKYENDDWTLKATLPYLSVSGENGVIPGIGKTGNANPKKRGKAGSTTGSAQGIGDVVLSAGYDAYYDKASKFGIDLTGKVKLGTADKDKGLGTGQNDYSAELGAYKGLDRFTLTGDIGYTVVGSAKYIKLKKNVVYVSVGGSYKVTDLASFGLSFDASQSVATASASEREVMAFVSYKLAKDWKLQPYITKGFADGSPDWGAGVTLNYQF